MRPLIVALTLAVGVSACAKKPPVVPAAHSAIPAPTPPASALARPVSATTVETLPAPLTVGADVPVLVIHNLDTTMTLTGYELGLFPVAADGSTNQPPTVIATGPIPEPYFASTTPSVRFPVPMAGTPPGPPFKLGVRYLGVSTPYTPNFGTFLGTNDVLHGSWEGQFGTQGFAIASRPVATLPVTVTGAQVYVWASSTTDVRGVAAPDGTDYVAACWYAGGVFTVDVNPPDSLIHKLTVYGVDYDTGNRAQRIELIDVETGAVLDTQNWSAFSAGRYASWRVRGHLQIRVTQTGPSNGMLSAVFLDPDPGGGEVSLMAPRAVGDVTLASPWTLAVESITFTRDPLDPLKGSYTLTGSGPGLPILQLGPPPAPVKGVIIKP